MSTVRYTVRLMNQSPHGGMVLDKRCDDFLVVNVNRIIDGELSGCATCVFDVALPTPTELRDSDLTIEGTWISHQKYGRRFDVEAFGIVKRPVTRSEPDKRKPTRRLSAVPAKPVKPVRKPTRRIKPSAGQVENTNDWYAKTGRRCNVMIRESTQVSAAGGVTPQADWKPQEVTPDLAKVLPREMLVESRNSIMNVFGVLPLMFDKSAQGPAVREGQRRLAGWTLQPIAAQISEEATNKLGSDVVTDVLRPVASI